MSDQFLGEIRPFPYNFAPTGWALCDGQLLPISQNTALFSLLGTTYGGDGKSTFALPNLMGRAPMQQYSAPGNPLSNRDLGEEGGSDTVTLLVAEIPLHTHGLRADTFDPSDLNAPAPNRVLAHSTAVFAYQPSNANLGTMAPGALPPAGGDQPHSNMQPYLALNYCIALQGIFPPRT